jgi:hypothetical protein
MLSRRPILRATLQGHQHLFSLTSAYRNDRSTQINIDCMCKRNSFRLVPHSPKVTNLFPSYRNERQGMLIDKWFLPGQRCSCHMYLRSNGAHLLRFGYQTNPPWEKVTKTAKERNVQERERREREREKRQERQDEV